MLYKSVICSPPIYGGRLVVTNNNGQVYKGGLYMVTHKVSKCYKGL